MWGSRRNNAADLTAQTPARSSALNSEPSVATDGVQDGISNGGPTQHAPSAGRPSPLATPSIGCHQQGRRQHQQTPSSTKKRAQMATPTSASSQMTATTAASTPCTPSVVSSAPSTALNQAPMPHYAYEDDVDGDYNDESPMATPSKIQNRILFQDDDNNDIDVSMEDANLRNEDTCGDDKDDNDFLQRRIFKAPLHGNRTATSLLSSPASPLPPPSVHDSDDANDAIDTDQSPSSSPERNHNQLPPIKFVTKCRDQSPAPRASSFGSSANAEPFSSGTSLGTTRLRQGQYKRTDRRRGVSTGSITSSHRDREYHHDLLPQQHHRNRKSKSVLDGSGRGTPMTVSSSGEPSSESESSPERFYTPSKNKDRNRRKKESRIRQAPSLSVAASSLLPPSSQPYFNSYERSSSASRRRSGVLGPNNPVLPVANGKEQEYANGKHTRWTSSGSPTTLPAKGNKKCVRLSTFLAIFACIANVTVLTAVMASLEMGPFSSAGSEFWKQSAFLRGMPTETVVHPENIVSVHEIVTRHGRTIGGSKILKTVGKIEHAHKSRTPQQHGAHKQGGKFDDLDILMYSKSQAHHSTKKEDAGATKEKTLPRTVVLHSSNKKLPKYPREVEPYPAEFSDNTQFYPVLDSSDERLSLMEVREPLDDGECKPMQDWQTTFHPSCNTMHELDLVHMDDEDAQGSLQLFGKKGFWRNAWKVDVLGGKQKLEDRETFVLKTLKFNHNFEDAHYEHDRVDAVAMERLTASKHVIDIYGFCGHSVSTEYADGIRLGYLADKSKRTPLKRLEIARDIASGLADVHGIDGEGINGDGNTTFVHLDVNPANVVVIGKTLKLNDFNIGILRRWNTTSNTHCGFPAQYPNPQWRSPEEARESQHLTEKVDIFSLGHIFFRLICGHEPWNKLEIGGKPSKEDMNEKVKNGVLPHIPHEIKESTEAEVVVIRDAMMKCYEFEPEKRPSAREIADTLNSALEKLAKEEKKKKEKKLRDVKKKKEKVVKEAKKKKEEKHHKK